MKKKTKVSKISMKKKTKVSKIHKRSTLLRGVISVYWLLICMIIPILICMIPVIPYILTNEPNWMWLMLLSIPIGMSCAMKMWEPDFISRYL